MRAPSNLSYHNNHILHILRRTSDDIMAGTLTHMWPHTHHTRKTTLTTGRV